MMATENYDMYMPNYSNYADIKALVNNFNIIDNGLALNVGNSTGTGNNYILDIGTITLTSANKGIRFMFFADKDSDTTNTVKIVINNKTYILLDMNKKNVRKIKKGVPITIAYAGDDTNFFLASGGEIIEYDSTSIATDGSNVLTPNTFVGSDGEIHTGTMPNNGTKIKQLTINETYTLGKGYYDSITVNQNITTKGSQIYTPSRNDQIIYANQYLNGNQTIKGDSNFIPENIPNGISIFGVLGTYKSSNNVFAYSSPNIILPESREDTTIIDCPFEPSVIVTNSKSETNYVFVQNNATGREINWGNGNGYYFSIKDGGYPCEFKYVADNRTSVKSVTYSNGKLTIYSKGSYGGSHYGYSFMVVAMR